MLPSIKPPVPRFNKEALRFVAIDSGASGAICVWAYDTKEFALYKLKGTDPKDLFPVLDQVLGDNRELDCVVIEEPPKFMGPKIPGARIAVLFESFGIMVGYLMAKNVKVIRITPHKWQKRLNDLVGTRGDMAHGDWKKVLYKYAQSRYGNADGLIGQTADSLLIAEWWLAEGAFDKYD